MRIILIWAQILDWRRDSWKPREEFIYFFFFEDRRFSPCYDEEEEPVDRFCTERCCNRRTGLFNVQDYFVHIFPR